MHKSNTEPRINIIKSEEEFSEAIKKIAKAKLIVLDCETEGLDIWNHHKVCGIGVYIPNADGYYFPIRHKESSLPLFQSPDSGDNIPLTWLPKLFKSINKVPAIVGHNLKFDLAALYQDGFEITRTQRIYDTITAARMYFPDKYQSLSLEAVTDVLLKHSDDSWKKTFKDYLKQNGWSKNYDLAPAKVVGEYCVRDCIYTYQVYEILTKYISDTKQERVWDQESELLSVLWRMEKEGLYFDREYCLDRLDKIHKKLEQLEYTIYAMVGRQFDIRSPKQLNEVMTELGITSPHLTPGGKPKWGVAELMTIEHPIVSVILEYRGIEKMRSTYFEPLPPWEDDRLHPSFKPWGAVTGRMSCTNPSLMNLSNKSQNLAGEEQNEEAIEAIKAMMGARSGQIVDMTSATGNISGGGSFAGLISYAKKYSDTEDSVAVRRLYIPPPGYSLYCIDFSQMEMRIFADYVIDEQLDALLENDAFDFHSHVAKEVWKVDESSSLWKFYRNLAKCINFGLIYGIGNDKLSSQIQKSVEEAIVYKREYFSRFPKALKFIHSVRDVVISRGYIVNRFGRRYTLPAEKSYVGVNYLVQGTGADIVKNRMVAIDDYLKDKQTKMVVQVHDELVFYVKDEEEKEVVPRLKALLEERQIKTFLPVDVSKGDHSWAEKRKVCTDCMEFKELCKCQKP